MFVYHSDGPTDRFHRAGRGRHGLQFRPMRVASAWVRLEPPAGWQLRLIWSLCDPFLPRVEIQHRLFRGALPTATRCRLSAIDC